MFAESALTLSNDIVMIAHDCAERIRNYPLEEKTRELGLDVTIDDVKFMDIWIEFIFLLIHYADRLAAVALSEHDREEFMEMLVQITMNNFGGAIFEKLPLSGMELGEKHLYEWLHTRSLEYSTMKLYAEEDEPLTGVLNWEFCKDISQKIVGEGASHQYMIMTNALVRAAFEGIEEAVKKIVKED